MSKLALEAKRRAAIKKVLNHPELYGHILKYAIDAEFRGVLPKFLHKAQLQTRTQTAGMGAGGLPPLRACARGRGLGPCLAQFQDTVQVCIAEPLNLFKLYDHELDGMPVRRPVTLPVMYARSCVVLCWHCTAS